MKAKIYELIDQNAEQIISMEKQIWTNPEIAYHEEFATKITKEALIKAGFKIIEIEGIPTAYYAEYGNGSPVISILGEYDALPGMSQEVSPIKTPVVQNGPGHGCGHNVMAVSCVGACLALKKLFDGGKIKGTLRFYACPAEEVLSGKTLMQTRNAFNGTDVAITWHPMTYTGIYGNDTDAMISVEFNFKGIASHAGSTPELGRSALDAVEIMNVSANYLREHVIKKSSIHYVTTNGGIAPNIVPESASVWYYIRATKKKDVYSIFDRLIKCAKGAAMATETEVDYTIKADCYEVMPNSILEDLLVKNIEELGKVPFTEKEYDFAKELIKSVPEDWYKNDLKLYGLEERTILGDSSIGIYGRGISDGSSTDVGDVSHIVPLASFAVAGVPVGIPFHSWQATASFGSSIADVVVVHAAKILAGSVYDLLTDKTGLIDAAKKEFNSKNKPYTTKLSADLKI